MYTYTGAHASHTEHETKQFKKVAKLLTLFITLNFKLANNKAKNNSYNNIMKNIHEYTNCGKVCISVKLVREVHDSTWTGTNLRCKGAYRLQLH